MPRGCVMSNWDQTRDQTLDHLSGIDRDDIQLEAPKDVSLARRRHRRRSRQVRPRSR